MSELAASHCTARRLARVSRKAYQAGSRSGCSSWSSFLNRRKAPLPWIARASLRLARPSEIPPAKSAMSVPDPGRQRLDEDQVQFIEADWCLPVDAGVSRPERDLSRVRIDQPVAFVIGLAGQPAGDLLQIEAAQAKHQARINLPRYLRSSTGTPTSGF